MGKQGNDIYPTYMKHNKLYKFIKEEEEEEEENKNHVETAGNDIIEIEIEEMEETEVDHNGSTETECAETVKSTEID